MAYCLINKSNYFFNLSKIEEKIEKDKIAVVIKNNAYGHGIKEIANLANEYGIKHAIVNNIAEAKSISSFFDTIIVLQETNAEPVRGNIIITLNSIESISQIPENTRVELKIDTGMHRNGILIDDMSKALDLILESKLILNGVFTHFSSAYLDDESLSKQKYCFDEIRKIIDDDSRFSHKMRFHCSASSSLFRIDNSEYDLVRIGLMSYGYISLPDSYQKPKLKPVMSLWGEKITSKKISKGDSIGYGQTYTASEDMKVSTYDIGYGDGFMRLNQDKKCTIEDGRDILGIVSMNSFSALGEDEKVCVFENAQRFADTHDTIIYEVIANINPKIKRKIL